MIFISRKSNVTINGIWVDGDLGNSANAHGQGISVLSGANNSILNSKVSDTYSAQVSVNGADTLTIDNLTTTNINGGEVNHGLDVDKDSSQGIPTTNLIIRNSNLSNGVDGGYAPSALSPGTSGTKDATKVENANNVTYTNNIIHGRANVDSNDTAMLSTKDITYSGNTFKSSVRIGGRSDGNITFDGNTFEGNSYLMVLNGTTTAQKVIVANNIFTNNAVITSGATSVVSGSNTNRVADGVTSSLTATNNYITINAGNTGLRTYSNRYISSVTTGDFYGTTNEAFSQPESVSNIKGLIPYATNTDVLWVADGTYTGTNNRNIAFSAKAITLRSVNGPTSTTIDCQSTATTPGFSLSSESSSLVISGFTVKNCTANSGGGMYIINSSPTISNMIFESNTASNGGGGIHIAGTSNPLLTGLIVRNNTSTGTTNGGGIVINAGSPTITQSSIHGNTAGGNGGGIRATGSGNPVVSYSQIYNNNTGSAGAGGGIQSGVTGSLQIINSTIFNNKVNSLTTANGAGIATFNATTTIKNSILRGSATPVTATGAGVMTITYSNVQGGYSGTGNANVDPLFTDSVAYDLSLQYNSPIIDAGVDLNYTADYFGNPPYDMPSISNTGSVGSYSKDYVDMGAYEYSTPPDLTITSSTHSSESTWYNSRTPVTITLASPYDTIAKAVTTDFRYLVNQTLSPSVATVRAGTLLDDAITFDAGGLVSSEGLWYVHIIAQNEASTTIFSTNITTYKIRYDGTNPTVAPLTPANNTSILTSQKTFTWGGSDAGSGIASYSLYIDDELNTSGITTTSSTISGTLACKGHTWYLQAVDNLGNTSTSNTYTFTTSCGGGGTFYGSASALPGYIKPRLQTVTDGKVTYLDIVATSTKATTQIPAVTQITFFIFSKPLNRGSLGTDVVALQSFLKKERNIYPEGVVNGIFGPATERAIKRFQVKHGIATYGAPGYGLVGPKTRAQLNVLMRE